MKMTAFTPVAINMNLTHTIAIHAVWGLLWTLFVVHSTQHVPIIVALYISACVHAGIVFMASSCCDVTPRRRHDVIGAVFVIGLQLAMTGYYVTSYSVGTLMVQCLVVAFVQAALHTGYLLTSGKRLTQHISFSSLPCL